jgi:hypothetical protein
MRLQRLANRRLMPIKAAKEVTNRMAARVNVGTGTGGKGGATTSVGGMRNTFNQFSWVWKIDKNVRSAVTLGGRSSVRFGRRCL